jgi:hypothetical protein
MACTGVLRSPDIKSLLCTATIGAYSGNILTIGQDDTATEVYGFSVAPRDTEHGDLRNRFWNGVDECNMIRMHTDSHLLEIGSTGNTTIENSSGLEIYLEGSPNGVYVVDAVDDETQYELVDEDLSNWFISANGTSVKFWAKVVYTVLVDSNDDVLVDDDGNVLVEG